MIWNRGKHGKYLSQPCSTQPGSLNSAQSRRCNYGRWQRRG